MFIFDSINVIKWVLDFERDVRQSFFFSLISFEANKQPIIILTIINIFIIE